MSGFKIWQATLAAFFSVLYWVLVLALPSKGDSWPSWVRIVTGLLGAVFFVWGVYVAQRSFRQSGEERAERFALGAVMAIVGLVFVVVAFLTSEGLDLTPARRFAVGVGGAALAGFVFAVGRFDTMRAAASVPVVILLIGVVVWPQASELVDDSVRESVVTWMGVILAANGAAEAAKQIGESNAKAKSPENVDVESSGDTA